MTGLKETGKKELGTQDNGAGGNRALVSDQKYPSQDNPVTSENLPLNVSMQLYRLMTKVVEDEVSPKTVNAACACASEIHKIIKLNLEMRKHGL